ncbi:MAG: DUF1854 domain-containing protein [Spirochaetaceae bacterium]|nr:DUF1854 domain-containing protein [Spirochaetaceae bacterium]
MRFLEPDQLKIARTAGGVLSLDVDGEEHYEYVDAYRVFPLSDGERWVSLRVHGGAEVGIIRRPEQLPEEQRRLLTEELERRYFAPRILAVESLVEKFGESHWSVATSAGPCRFRVHSDHTQIREIADGALLIIDADGNRYRLEHRERLPRQILKRIEEQI